MLRSGDMSKCVHRSCLPLTDPTQLKSIFQRFDNNKDGRLSKQELRHAFASLGSRLPGWRAGRAIRHADSNGDGYISDDELNELINYALKCGYTKYTIT